MKRLSLIFIIGCLVLGGCKTTSEKQPQAVTSIQPAAKAKTYSPMTAPTHKEVLRALLQIQDVGLSISSTCSGVGTQPSDTDIGDYISGFLAEQDSSKGGNSIEVSTKDEAGIDGAHGWRSEVMIRHLDGDDRWGWGVSFLMRAADHSVVRESVRCLGAG